MVEARWRDAAGQEHRRACPTATEAMTLLRREVERGGVQIGEPVEIDRWFARWRDAAGRSHKKSHQTLGAARDHLHDEDSRRRRNESTPTARDGRRAFADVAEIVKTTSAGRRTSTRARDESVMNSLVLPTFADVPIRDISETAVERWLASLVDRGCARSTIQKAFQLLGRVMRYAARKRWIPRSPLEDVELGEILPNGEHTEQRFLDAEQITRLADAIDPRYRTLVLTAAYTGARFGELAALRVERIDFLRRQIRIEETLNEVRGEIVVSPCKTRRSRRTISVPSFLVELLAAEVQGKPADGYVFTAPGSGPLRRNTFRQRFWMPAVRASVGEPLRFHDMRHSHAAMLIARREHPKTIADRLGHASIRVSMDVYGHLLEGLDQGAADGLDALYRQTGAAPKSFDVVEIGEARSRPST